MADSAAFYGYSRPQSVADALVQADSLFRAEADALYVDIFSYRDMSVIGALNRLASMDGLLDGETVWKNIADGGAIESVCSFAVVLLFGMMLMKGLKTFIDNGFEFRIMDYWGLLGKTFLILMFFCVFYPGICGFFIKFAAALNEGTAGQPLEDFRVAMRELLLTFQQPGADKADPLTDNAVFRAIGNIISMIKFFYSSLIRVMLMGAIHLLLMVLYVYISIGHFFVMIALFLGPICMALSLVFPGIGRAWANFLLAGIFFGVIVGIGFVVIADSGMLSMAKYTTFTVQSFHTFVIIILMLSYLTMIPFVIAQIFGCSAFSFLGRMLGWLYGTSIVFSPLVVVSEILNYSVGDSFSAKKNVFGGVRKK